jgi:hypothetical protein
LFETLNNHVDLIKFWTWFNPPIYALKYVDAESIITFAKDLENTSSCFMRGKCHTWTAYRRIFIARNDKNKTRMHDSVQIIDCTTGKGGFYDTEKKRFIIFDEDKEAKLYKIQPSQKEHKFICSQPEAAYLKDITLKEIGDSLATWEPLEAEVSL